MSELPDLAKLAEETLDPELEPYLEESTFLGLCLKHPLVFQVPYFNAGMANLAYRHKTGMVDKARSEKDWHSYIWLHERPYRFDALNDVLAEVNVSDEDEHSLIRDVWIDSENVWQHFYAWVEIFSHEDLNSEMLMTDKERARLAALPEVVRIYRGATLEMNEDGLSWTLDQGRAKWFAERFSHRGSAVVIHADVPRDQIVALLEGRSEDEVIVLPENYTIDHYEEL